MSLESVLDLIPSDWCWCIDQPPSWNKGGGKKKKRYTVYVSNEYLYGNHLFVSFTLDGNDLVDTLQKAVQGVLDLQVKKAAERAKELAKQKKS